MPNDRRSLWLWPALGYLAFVIYGSLVPWAFRAMPLADAWEAFKNVPFLQLGIGSRADWVANLLLFIPLAFLWSGVLWPRQRGPRRALAALVVILSGVVLSVAIEFTQLFFPPRTVSRNDILAESLGGVLGVLAWWRGGEALTQWLEGWRSARGPGNLAGRLLLAYLAVLLAYALLPLDLTISPVEVYHKWQEGKVHLVPFAHTHPGPVELAYALAADTVIWAPVSLLWILSGRRSPLAAWGGAVAVAAGIEAAQLFVYSRVTDVTDVLTATLGAGIGAWIGRRRGRGASASPLAPARTRLLLAALGFLLWCMVLFAVFWYPFDFTRDWALLRERADRLLQVPFRAYYFGTEFRAATEVLHKLSFFAPLGVLLAYARSALSPPVPLRRLFDVLALGLLLGVAVIVELGQVALPGKFPDSADLILQTLGGVLGYAGWLFLSARWQPGAGRAAHVAARIPRAERTALDGGGLDTGGRAAGRDLKGGTLPPLAPAAARSTPPAAPAATAEPAAPAGARPPESIGVTGSSLLPDPVAAARIPTGGPPASAAAVPGPGYVADAEPVSGPAARALPVPAAAGTRRLPVRTLALLLLGLVLLAPFAPEAGWTLSSSAGTYLSELPRRLYALYKSVLLWTPVGVLLVLAGKEAVLRTWAPLPGGLFLLAAPWLHPGLGFPELVEAAAAPLGLWSGLWIGLQVQRRSATLGAAASSPGTSEAAVNSAAASAAALVPAAPPAPVTPARRRAPEGAAAPVGRLGVTDLAAGVRTAAPRLAGRAGALALLAATLLLGLDFPVFGPWIAAGLLAYAAVLYRHPGAWIIAIPALLPVLDLAPWTGRFFFDELDLVLLVTLAAALWHGPLTPARLPLPRSLRLPLALFSLSWLLAAAIGLWPLQALDANAFSSYWSHYNALRVGKGLLWGLSLLLLAHVLLPRGRAAAMRQLGWGIGLGLAGVLLVGLRERWQFAGLLDFAEPYRIAATFSSMHTGGGHIEAYLVAAIPFLWLWIAPREQPALRVLGGVLLLFAAYVMVVTVARGGVGGLAVALLVLAGMAWYTRTKGAQSLDQDGAKAADPLVSGVAVLATMAVLALGLTGPYFQQRLASTGQDAGIRAGHWLGALDLMRDGLATTALGMGLGRFPSTYLFGTLEGPLPGSYRFPGEAAGSKGSDSIDAAMESDPFDPGPEPGEAPPSFLRLGSGETLYMAQRVTVSAATAYRISLRVRSTDAGARLDVPICEKHLLNSFRCVWQSVRVPEDGQWHRQDLQVNTGEVGSGNLLTRRPTEIFFYNPGPATVVDVTGLSLMGPDGTERIRNGDFAAGGDHWFFKTHSHLPWHIKNLWVHLYFEQGLLGLVAFLWLAAAALVRLFQSGREPFARVALAALVGMLAVGLFDSLLDAPRLATLLFLLLLVAPTLASPATPGPRFLQQSRSRPGAPSRNRHRPGATGRQPVREPADAPRARSPEPGPAQERTGPTTPSSIAGVFSPRPMEPDRAERFAGRFSPRLEAADSFNPGPAPDQPEPEPTGVSGNLHRSWTDPHA